MMADGENNDFLCALVSPCLRVSKYFFALKHEGTKAQRHGEKSNNNQLISYHRFNHCYLYNFNAEKKIQYKNY